LKKKQTETSFHVTETLKCAKRLWYLRKKVKALKPHFFSLEGKVEHEFFALIIKGEPYALRKAITKFVSPKRVAFSLYLMKRLQGLEPNFRSWLAKVDLSEGFELEPELKGKLNGYSLIGRPDLLTSTSVIDFKPSKKRVSLEFKAQLFAYEELAYQRDKRRRTAKLVFITPETIEEVELDGKSLEEGKKYLLERLKLASELMKSFSPAAEPGFECAYCEFNYKCRGY